MNAIGDEQSELALAYTFGLRNLGILLRQSPNSSIRSAGRSINSFADSAERTLLSSELLDKDQLERLSTFFREGLDRRTNPVSWIDLEERFQMLDLCQIIAIEPGCIGLDFFHGGQSNGPQRIMDSIGGLSDWNKAMILANQFFDRLVAAGAEPVDHKRLAAYREIDIHQQEIDARQATYRSVMRCLFVGPSSRGRWFANAYLSNSLIVLVEEMEIAVDMGIDLSLVAIAVFQYRNRTGKFPTHLVDLTPGLMTTLPVDRFTGSPLVYSVTADGFEIQTSKSYVNFLYEPQ